MTPDDRLSGLVERLEKSSGPLRELDVLIFGLAVDLVDGKPWSDADLEYAASAAERTCNAPRYTSSIDAAMALLPPHCELSEISRNVCWDDGEPEREWCVTVHQEDEDGYARAQHSAPGDTFALAICAAALKSRSPQP